MSTKKPDHEIRDFPGPLKKAAIPLGMARIKSDQLPFRARKLTEKKGPVKGKESAFPSERACNRFQWYFATMH
jgi:hypothetical protein